MTSPARDDQLRAVRRIPVEEFFADPAFSAPTLSPDGKRLAYLAPAYGQTNVWVRALEEEHHLARCVTHSADRGIKTYYWSHNPRWLLYRQDAAGNEDWHLYRVDLNDPDAPALDLTPLEAGARVVYVEISHREPSSVLVMMNKRPMFFDLFSINITTGETVLLREADDLFSQYLGPEGGSEFFTTLTAEGIREYYACDPEGQRRLVYSAGGPDYPVDLYPQIVTRDASALIVGAYPENAEHLQLLSIDHSSGHISALTSKQDASLCTMGLLEADFGHPPSVFISAKTGRVYAARFVGDRPTVEVVDPNYASLIDELSAIADGEIGWLSSDTDEQYWLVTYLHDTQPGRTYLYERSTGLAELVFNAYPHLDPRDLAPMRAISFNARDGLPLHGFLTLPAGLPPKKLPTVLLIHGGPWTHDYWGYQREVQFLANRGYAVLQLNFRGSTGYGRTHITAAVRELAGRMHEDLIDACDWAIGLGITDPQRLAIQGTSYGGYAALVSSALAPDYFAATIDHVGITNLTNLSINLPPFMRPLLINNWLHYTGDPHDPTDHADMLARSPITLAERITSPVLVIAGANDARVPRSESDSIVEALQAREIEVGYFVAGDEGHDFRNPANMIRMYELIEAHLERHCVGSV